MASCQYSRAADVARVREPVERGVVEPVVAGDGAEGVPSEELGEVLVGGRVVVKEPGREADGRVRQAVADRLRARALDNAVAAVIGRERDLFIRALFLLRQVRRRRIGVADVAEHAGRNHLREVDVDAGQPCGRLARHRCRDRGAPVAALRDVAVYPSRCISAAHARAMQSGPRPGPAGLPENP